MCVTLVATQLPVLLLCPPSTQRTQEVPNAPRPAQTGPRSAKQTHTPILNLKPRSGDEEESLPGPRPHTYLVQVSAGQWPELRVTVQRRQELGVTPTGVPQPLGLPTPLVLQSPGPRLCPLRLCHPESVSSACNSTH